MADPDRTAVIVTGGASGIGRATALALAEAGRPVALWDLDPDRAAAAAAACHAAGAPAAIGSAVDVTSRDAVSAGLALARSLGPLRGLVHAAGIARMTPHGLLDDATWDATWDAVLDVNLAAFARLARAVLPAFARDRGGSVVAISSVEGFIGHRHLPAYCASKAGLLGLVRSLAHQYAPEGIRVNAVCPGAVDTPMLAPLLGLPGYRTSLEKRIPLGRIADAAEVGRVVRFLLSDDASYVTGQSLVVDGGLLAAG